MLLAILLISFSSLLYFRDRIFSALDRIFSTKRPFIFKVRGPYFFADRIILRRRTVYFPFWDRIICVKGPCIIYGIFSKVRDYLLPVRTIYFRGPCNFASKDRIFPKFRACIFSAKRPYIFSHGRIFYLWLQTFLKIVTQTLEWFWTFMKMFWFSLQYSDESISGLNSTLFEMSYCNIYFCTMEIYNLFFISFILANSATSQGKLLACCQLTPKSWYSA